jgi:hypothetical protein
MLNSYFITTYVATSMYSAECGRLHRTTLRLQHSGYVDTLQRNTALQFRVKGKYSPPKLHVSLTVHHSIYHYSETNVVHFLFSLLRIKDLYMFRALLAHPQEALHKQNLVYCVLKASHRLTVYMKKHINGNMAHLILLSVQKCVMSVGCTWCSQLT